MGVITEWLQRRRRRIDLEILWPAIRSKAASMEVAKQAFRLHVYCDKAWNGISWPEIERMLEDHAA
jgi:hypothetical protein